MQVLFPNCAGLDVHKRSITACRLQDVGKKRPLKEVRTFGTMTADLEALATWLLEAGCTHILMESTGVYWHPVYNILEDRFTVWLVNARHIKTVPGRKTDVKDAEWLAQLLQYGLVRPSFIPPREQRELRDIVRYRQTLIDERNRISNRIQKLLEGANLKLASVVSDIQGVSAQAMLRALVAGTVDPATLAQFARGSLRHKIPLLIQALEGRFQGHHRFLLTHLLSHLDFLDSEIRELETQLEALATNLPDVPAMIDRLDTIPGINRQLAILLIAEIGFDLSRFPDAKHLTAWAGLAPGNNESAGKTRSATARPGNQYLRRGLVQAAHAAARKKGSYLKSLYARIATRRGARRAALAVARTLLQIAYYLLVRKDTYRDLGADYFDQRDRERTTKRLLGRLKTLGYTVSLQSSTAPG